MADIAGLVQRFIRAYPGRRDEALAVVNGAVGDRLADFDSPLAISMQLFQGDAFVPLETPPVAVPEAGREACVYVHGLMGSERAWQFGVDPNAGERAGEPGGELAEAPTVHYGPAIAEARGQTSIYVRYNTGRHISQNGRELADQLEHLLRAWPGGGFDAINIVAHSMGGLVTRSACHYALEAGHGWVDRLERAFLLGVPSRGAPLEQLAHVAAFTLETIWNPITRVIGRLINQRSAGIKDLRHGFVLDEDWRDRDLDRTVYPLPSRARYPKQTRWFVALGQLGQPDDKWGTTLGWTLGDGLVRSGSARGESLDPRMRELLPPAEARGFDSTSHIALMRDPAVLEQILAWWT